MKKLDSAQVEQLRQIGEYLYHLREQQAISLEEVANRTFIPLRLLEAIEIADVQRLPEPVYVKGFIRRYGDVLGVDGTEIADAFPIESYSVAQSPEAEEEIPPSQPTYSSYRGIDSSDRPSRSLSSYIPYAVAGVIGVIAVSAIAIGASNAFRSNSPQKAEPQSNSSPVSAPPITTNSATTNSRPNSSASSSPAPGKATSVKPATPDTTTNGPVKVDVKLTDRSWVEVVIDNNVEFEGILEKGDQRSWAGQKNVQIRAGNAGGVVVSHNQGEAKPLGKVGEVVNANFANQQEPSSDSEAVSQQ